VTRTPREHPIVYLYCIAISALLLYVPGFVVAAYGRLWVGYDLRQPRTMIDRVPAYARRATWAHENSFEAFALFGGVDGVRYWAGRGCCDERSRPPPHRPLPLPALLHRRSTGPAGCDVPHRFAVLSDPDRSEPHSRGAGA